MYSQITIIGNVGRDPEIKHLPDGSIVANFSVAVNEKYTKRDGSHDETTTWFNVDAWQSPDRGGLVDIVSKYVRAGSQVFIQGRPVIQMYEKDGVKHYPFRIKLSGPAAQLRLLGRRQQADVVDPETGEVTQPNGAASLPARRKPVPASLSDDDVPF